MARRASAASPSPSDTGEPTSPPAETAGSSGIVPMSGTPASSASVAPPPSPNTACRSPCSQRKALMFSMTPSTWRWLLRAMVTARLATRWAARAGVVTTIISAWGSIRARPICTSPVPGGRSMTQVVEVVGPGDVLEEVLHRPVEDEATPHEGVGLVVDEQAHRHDVEAPGADRHRVGLDATSAVGGGLGVEPALEAEHAGDGEAPDVGVDARPRRSRVGERGGEVGGDRGLADPALAGGDGEHAGTDRHGVGAGRALGVARAMPIAVAFCSAVISVQSMPT